jgi:hypothetical protein
LFKSVVLKITRRNAAQPIQTEEPGNWDPLNWLRSWECEPWQQTETMVNEPCRNVNHILESIFSASIWTGFML